MSILGLDRSGNGNDFIAVNITANDQMVDSPTNNFATMNPLDKTNIGAVVYTEGNLVVDPTPTEGGNPIKIFNNMYVSSGKWYWEVTALNFGTSFTTSGHSSMKIGVTNDYNYHATETNNSIGYRSGDYAILFTDGNKHNNNASSSYGSEIQKLDILQIALDLDNNKIWFGNNGTWFASGNPATGANPAFSNLAAGDYAFGINDWNRTSHAGKFAVNFGSDSSFAGNKTAQGNQDSGGIGDFYYAPPTGFLALCTSNLPDATVIPSEHFNALLYTGNGGTGNHTGVGFQPDFVWIKGRNIAENHALHDAVRGTAAGHIRSDTTNAESANEHKLEYGADGFNFIGGTPTSAPGHNQVNSASYNYVAWNWKANGSGSSNTNGSINTTKTSANVDAGFSIITYTGNAVSGASIGHGLSKAPEFWTVKERGSGGDDWNSYHKGIASDAETDWIRLNGTAAAADAANIWNDQAPTSSLIYLGNSGEVNGGSGETFVCYAFHSVDGYSKVGSYIGNGNNDGTFVYTGFRPAFVIAKVSTAGTHGWAIYNSKSKTYNPLGNVLQANATNAEMTSEFLDFTSNGFKHRTSSTWNNGSGQTYIYIAFAESPFKYSNAR